MYTDTTWISKMKELELKSDSTEPSDYTENNEQSSLPYDPGISENHSTLFNFDPNKITEDQWHQLGISQKTSTTILKYLGKGGSFRKPEDLKKIYGMKPVDYERLLPYIQIASIKDDPLPDFASAPDKKNTLPNNGFAGRTIIDINKADTTAFIRLPGIGSKLAARIVTFRDRLGGFYSIEQIGEIYGLHDSVFQKIKDYMQLGNTPVKKININTATIDELKNHPYLKSAIALPVIAYRNEHGPFSRKEDIKKVLVITDEHYIKLAPYITTQ